MGKGMLGNLSFESTNKQRMMLLRSFYKLLFVTDQNIQIFLIMILTYI